MMASVSWKNVKRIIFFILLSVILLNCGNRHEPAVLNNVVIYNVQDSLCIIHPFSTDEGFAAVVPHWWKDEDVRVKGNLDSVRINIYKTHVSTLFINTQSGTMDFIHADKKNKEQAHAIFTTSDGIVQYDGKIKMHGRGNLTWSGEKKPYNIKLANKCTILDLNKSKNYCLLANACDPTSLRNWVAFNVAEELALPYPVKSEYITLYLNGCYAGLYMITNKVDVEKGAVDIYRLQKKTELQNEKDLKDYKHYEIQDDQDCVVEKGYEIPNDTGDVSGGYLLDLCYKAYAESKSGFIPQKDIPASLKYPKYATPNQVRYIRRYFDESVDALAANDGANPTTLKHFTEYIDVSSFVRYYMVQEILMNLDGGRGSLIFYKDKGGKLFAGPIWDFDLALSTDDDIKLRNSVNAIVVANRKHIDGSPFILGYLVQHQEIQDSIRDIYKKSAKDIIRKYTTGELLENKYQALSHDIKLNNMRWQINIDVREMVEQMKEKASARIDFLDELWEDRIYNENNIVRLNIGMGTANGEAHNWEHEFYIKEKMALPVLPLVWEGKKNCGWYDYRTNTKYSGDSVKSPAHLYLKWEKMSLLEKLLRKIM